MRQLLDERLPLNIYRMLAHAPALMPGWMELGRRILYQCRLEPRLRELAILRVGHLSGSAYEVHQHRKIAITVGLSAEKIAGTEREADAKIYDDREVLVLRMAEQVVRKVKADDALFAAVVAALGNEQTMELLITIGFYMMAARIMENTQIEIETAGGPSMQEVGRFFGHQAKS